MVEWRASLRLELERLRQRGSLGTGGVWWSGEPRCASNSRGSGSEALLVLVEYGGVESLAAPRTREAQAARLSWYWWSMVEWRASLRLELERLRQRGSLGTGGVWWS